MPKWGLGRKDKKKEKEIKPGAEPKILSKASSSSPTRQHIAIYGADNKQHKNSSSSISGQAAVPDSPSPTPSNSSLDLVDRIVSPSSLAARRKSGPRVAAQKAFYEDLNIRKISISSGPKTNSSASDKEVKKEFSESVLSCESNSSSKISMTFMSPTSVGSRIPSSNAYLRRHDSPLSCGEMGSPGFTNMDMGRGKYFDGIDLPLPQLHMTAVRHREVDARRNSQSGGFGFILRKSYLPSPEDPDKTKLVHLIEPRADYYGPLMTGDRIIGVNGEDVEDAPHEAVVEMIKASGEYVDLRVASMPELVELNARGALDNPLKRSGFRKFGRAKQETGTLRKQNKSKIAFKAKTEAEVRSEMEDLSLQRVWVMHKRGFTLGTVMLEPLKRLNCHSSHASFFRLQGKETLRVKIELSDEVIELEDEDTEKANPASMDKVEDLVNLTHLNESSVLHVLRQRYGSSLIHTFAGRHLLVLNPLKLLSSYVDRVIDMFSGCRREDMPPHIFAMGQQAYRNMMVTRHDQSLILMGLSGSGKTFNTRYLLRYLTTIGQPEQGPVTNAKLDAVELLLHSFSSAATVLNPQATRCGCLYSLNFDPSGTIVGASIQTFLLEKNRIPHHYQGEGSFNIFYQLIAGADEQLTSDLLLDAMVETEDSNLYCDELDDVREESGRYVWDLIQNCLEILDITNEEALGLWSLLAAIYHLGFAGVKKGAVRGSDYFLNPAAAQRAAFVLGVDHETLGQDIFSPPRGTSRMSTLFSAPFSVSSPTQSDTGSMTSSLYFSNINSNRSLFLDGFVMGLYEQAFNALVMLINRSLQAPVGSKTFRSTINILDTPGFQDRELAGASDGASFDDLCMNYLQERLQMLFHDVTFTIEQDRYIQEDINWVFSEVASSPLSVIDTIDRHIPQRRGGVVDFHTDRRGLLWILDEESVFPGASDSSFLDRLHMYHGAGSTERGEPPLIKVIKEDNQFVIYHCQQMLPVLYDANDWLRQAREHPSFRVVVQTLAISKRPSVAAIFQGRGVAASATSLSNSQLKVDSQRSIARANSNPSANSLHYPGSSSSIKKSSISLQTKFRIDYLVDTLRKTCQWFICCILPQMPHKLPGALPSPDTTFREEQLDGISSFVDIDVPLVRDQLRRAEIIKAARIYKQGFPEHMSFGEFSRRYHALLPCDDSDEPVMDVKEQVELILFSQSIEKSIYRVGLSQTFFRAGTLASLDQLMEERTHDTMVHFQAKCRGWLGRKHFRQLEVQDSAALVIQQNVLSYLDVRDWSWWKLFLKVKPLLAMWRAEEDIKERDSKITKLKMKVDLLENERNSLKESEANLETKVDHLMARFDEVQSSAHEASDMMEGEQMEKRELEEKLTETMVHESELVSVNEQLHMQLAEMSILARIKQSEEGGEKDLEGDAMLEKYYEARRELETITQRITSEFEDNIESLKATKRSLEKKLADSESERDDLHRTLAQVRKKAAKVGSEMNDLKLHLETQQSRNAELEKRQRRFDVDLTSAKDDSNSEVQARERLAREKNALQAEYNELKEKAKALDEANRHLVQDKEDLESELLSKSSLTTESELTSLKRIKRDMEAKIEELEDELDESNMKLDSLQQAKARLELSNQTLKQQHSKELEGREEELEQAKVTLNKKLKAMSQQLEEVHEEKNASIKAQRELEREMVNRQSRIGDTETMKKLKRQLKKYKALLEDTQEQLEHESEMRGNSAAIRSLKNLIEELQTSESMAVKNYKRLQGETEELQIQCDEVTKAKFELDSRVNDLSRLKSELDGRIEEDQDEIEELLEKQRSHLSQASSLQAQLVEKQMQVEEVEEAKASLESKVESLQSKVTELESGSMNRHQFEVTEHKVKELEQKLELERSSARRHESQISRLRNQLERLREEKSDDVSHKSTESLTRAQKQIRELRGELQEAERKEQEIAKKKRIAEARIDELESNLQNSQADLKSAQKRIEQLHSALKDHEEFSEDDNSSHMSNISSDESNYSLADDGSDLDSDKLPLRTMHRTLNRNKIIKDKSSLKDNGKFRGSRGTLSRSRSRDLMDGDDVFDFEASRKARQERLKKLDDEDDFSATRKARQERLKKHDDEEDDFSATKKARQERLKKLDDDEDDFCATRKSRKERLNKHDDDDDDFEAKRKARKKRLEDLDSPGNTPKKGPRKASVANKDYDDDDDDDDLEQFLLKQRERMRNLDKESEEDDVKTNRHGDLNGMANKLYSRKNSKSREPSAETAAMADEEDSSLASRQRRKRQRRRTIEQLKSPLHKTNGVNL